MTADDLTTAITRAAQDGGWSSWSEWSDRSVTCGLGAVVVRRRSCSNPKPENNGKNYHGVYFEVKNVTNSPCGQSLLQSTQSVLLNVILRMF